MSKVSQWLEQLGLGQYVDAFAENDIDWELLPQLDHEALKDIGVASTGHRLRLLKAIAALDSEKTVPPAPREQTGVETAQSTASSSEAQRRQLTVMFCDLARSTTLAERLDPEDFRDVIRRYQDACAGVISRYEGYIARYVGDGLLVYFGFPQAHEDDAERAIRSALGILESVSGLVAGDGFELAVRIGVATGLVVVGDIVGEGASQEQAVIGETPNLAARLQGLASEQSTVISHSTKRLLGGQFDFEDLGQQRLKGITKPVRVWRVMRERAVESRFGAAHTGLLTNFIGREQEVALLLERWGRSKASEGQVVLLSGEAGIGKSRITQMLHKRLANEEHLRIQNQCSPHHVNSPLYPAIQQIEFAAEIGIEDMPVQKLDKLEQLLALSSSAPDTAPLIAALLAIPTKGRYAPVALTPDEQRQKTLQALLEIFEDLAERHPVLFVFEDAHWIDPTTHELMDLLVERVAALRALVVVTHRPEFVPPWTGHAHCTALTLNRMGREACAELISEVAQGRALPEEVCEQIIDKTDGVPLFVEELTKTVLESELLTLQDDRYVLTGPLPALAIPSTLQDSLMARLDRLEGVKEIAQIGATIGREFSHTLLEAAAPFGGQELEHALARLVEAEIVFRRGIAPTTTFVFKHALIQDTAYESLLRSRRQQIHAKIAETLQNKFRERVQNEPEVVAHHYTHAGLPGQAAPFWLEAGQRAVARSANHEATTHLRRGLEVLAGVPCEVDTSSLQLDMQISLGSASIGTKGYSAVETEEAYLRGRELLERIGDDPRQFAVLHGLSMCYINQAKMGQQLPVAEEMLSRAELLNDATSSLVAHRVMAVTQNVRGNFAIAREHAERAAALYDSKQHRYSGHLYGHDQGVGANWHVAVALMFLGFADASNNAEHRASSLAWELEHASTSLYDSLWSAFISVVKRDWRKAKLVTEAMIEDAAARSMMVFVVYGRHFLGSALAALGDSEAALDEIHRGRIEANQINHRQFMTMTLCFEAQALADLGQIDPAFSRLDEALAQVDVTEERIWEAEIQRCRGTLNQQRDGPREYSESSFRRAIDVARGQESKLLELRAATSLARLLLDQGRRIEASEVLAPVYDWFTEGFDTTDLKDAKALLEQLS